MPSPNQKPLEQRLEEAARRAEEDLRRFVRYLDAEVVPEVRRHSSTALRTAAQHLQHLADTMDDARTGADQSGKGTTSGPNP
jgi:hypothetical protein